MRPDRAIRQRKTEPRLTSLCVLVLMLVSNGCYQWTQLPAERLRGLQPEGVQQVAAARANADHRPTEPAITPPPEGVRIRLRSGEVVRLQRPFVITEVEPGQFRVLDRKTPTRDIHLSQVSRVEMGHENTTAPLTTFLVLAGIALIVGGLVSLNSGALAH